MAMIIVFVVLGLLLLGFACIALMRMDAQRSYAARSARAETEIRRPVI